MSSPPGFRGDWSVSARPTWVGLRPVDRARRRRTQSWQQLRLGATRAASGHLGRSGASLPGLDGQGRACPAGRDSLGATHVGRDCPPASGLSVVDSNCRVSRSLAESTEPIAAPPPFRPTRLISARPTWVGRVRRSVPAHSAHLGTTHVGRAPPASVPAHSCCPGTTGRCASGVRSGRLGSSRYDPRGSHEPGVEGSSERDTDRHRTRPQGSASARPAPRRPSPGSRFAAGSLRGTHVPSSDARLAPLAAARCGGHSPAFLRVALLSRGRRFIPDRQGDHR